jgi:hypothetical protein
LLCSVGSCHLLKSTPELESTPKHTIFGLFFIGAFLVALIAFHSWLNRKANQFSGNINIPGCCGLLVIFFGTKVLLR